MTATAHQRAELMAIMAEAEAQSLKMLEESNAGNGPTVELSPSAEQMYAHMTRDKFDGLDIHCENGGWFADVLLKDMPPYMCSCFGTPNHRPLPDEKTARDKAVDMLANALFLIYTRAAAPKPEPDVRAFAFFDVWINLPVQALKLTEIARQVSSLADGYDFSESAIRARLDGIKRRYFGDGQVTVEGINALSRDDRAMIVTVCVIAAVATGIIRHPPTGAYESIKCPRCGIVSYNHTDIQTRYCGACHKFHDDP